MTIFLGSYVPTVPNGTFGRGFQDHVPALRVTMLICTRKGFFPIFDTMHRYINIVLADDDPDDHFLFREALQQSSVLNCNVVSVYSGIQLTDYLLHTNSYAASKDPLPDFIVIDLNMPLVDGFKVIELINSYKNLRDIPVFVLTTSKSEIDQAACVKLGVAGFFTKPMDVVGLSKIVSEMLEGVSQ